MTGLVIIDPDSTDCTRYRHLRCDRCCLKFQYKLVSCHVQRFMVFFIQVRKARFLPPGTLRWWEPCYEPMCNYHVFHPTWKHVSMRLQNITVGVHLWYSRCISYTIGMYNNSSVSYFGQELRARNENKWCFELENLTGRKPDHFVVSTTLCRKLLHVIA